jgi:HAE1 family hydrophobic/amphiphilic exporter-1
MKLPEFSVNRSVTVLMLIGIIVVLGIISLSRLTVEVMPDLTYPTASVITTYEGAASEDIETLVTKPIEAAVSKVKNVKTVDSISQEEISIIMVEFEWGTNVDFAAQDMRDAIGVVEDFLPEGIDKPIVIKFDPSIIPIIALGITGERDLRDLRTLVKDQIKDRLEMVDGVATCMIMGGREREIQVRIDKEKLKALNIPIQQVISTLRYENLDLSGGHITRGYTEYLLRTLGEFENLDQIRNTVIIVREQTPVILKDFAEVYDTHTEVRNYSRTNKKNGLILAVTKESGANDLEVANGIKKKLKEVKKDLPSDIKIYTALDQGRITQLMISTTASDAIWGGLLAVVILFLFLRNWRPTLSIALSIPLSILATFIAVYFAGFSLNIMTMSGLALGVGMLVSNAIIVIENIFRHLEEGKNRNQAAIVGTSEVGMAITASTLTTIAVFLPLIYATGIAGKLSQGLALTVTFALIGSLFTALTLIPMMASKIFKKEKSKKDYERNFGEKGFNFLKDWYKRTLVVALRHRIKVSIAAIGMFALSMCLLPFVGKEFMPAIDPGLVIVKVKMPVGTSLEETDRVVQQIEDVMMRQKEADVLGTFTGLMEGTKVDIAFSGSGIGNTGVNEAMIFAHLVDKSKRKRSNLQIQDSLRRQFPQIEGAKIEFLDLARFITSGGTGQIPIEIKIFGKDLGQLEKIADEIMAKTESIQGLYDIDTTLRHGKPELQFVIDRDKASQLGLNVGQIASVMRANFEGQVATRYRTDGDEFDLRVQYRDEDSQTFDDVKRAVIFSSLGSQHHLEDVARVLEGKGPVKLYRENQKRKTSITANFSDRDLGSILNDIKAKIKETNLPSGYFVEYGGEAKRMRETFVALGTVFILAILLVYMIMAAQFESLVHPFTVMFTVPFGITGVIFILLLTGNSLSMVSLLGVIILTGVVVNNGIVLVDYVNQLRAKGMSKDEALIQGGVIKLRAVLLTAATATFGMLPMAISSSEGSELRSPMALAVIGGLVVSTFLTLIIVPTVYSILDDIAHRTRKEISKRLIGEE